MSNIKKQAQTNNINTVEKRASTLKLWQRHIATLSESEKCTLTYDDNNLDINNNKEFLSFSINRVSLRQSQKVKADFLNSKQTLKKGQQPAQHFNKQ